MAPPASLASSTTVPQAQVATGGPRAMSRTLTLLDTLARAREGLTLSEISKAIDVPKSTLLASLRALAADGFLICEGSAYRLGPAAFRLAGTILSSNGMPELARHYVRDLASSTRESVGYAIADWEIGQAIYTDAVNSTQAVHYAMRAGIRAPLYASAAGRVLLAYASRSQRAAYFARARLRPLTPNTEIDAAAIEQRLAIIAEEGFCSSFGEMLKDTAAIAVPVFDAAGLIGGAMMIAAPLERMRVNYAALLDQIRRAGRLASGLPIGDGAGPSAL